MELYAYRKEKQSQESKTKGPGKIITMNCTKLFGKTMNISSL